MRSSFKYSLCLFFNLILTSLIFLSLDNDNLFVLGFLGVFHPLNVHLPIGLWFGFIIFLLIGTIKKSIHIFPFLKIISIGDSQSSEIIRRINLPVHDKFHMPPSEPYITNNEKEIIEWWINHSFSKNSN